MYWYIDSVTTVLDSTNTNSNVTIGLQLSQTIIIDVITMSGHITNTVIHITGWLNHIHIHNKSSIETLLC